MGIQFTPAAANSSICSQTARKMNSLGLTITTIILVVTLSSTVAQTWYSPCMARGTTFKCPGYLRTQKMDFPMCRGQGDQYACYEDSRDTIGGWRRGKVTTPCDQRSRLGGCPSGFRRAVDESSHCKDTFGGSTIRLTCTALMRSPLSIKQHF